jgi:hypothetical protein
MNSKDQYQYSTQAVYCWWKLATALLEDFMKLFTSIMDKGKARAWLGLFTTILDIGQKRMTDAMYQLEASSKSFNTAAGKLTTLNSMLKEDFSKGSSYFDSAVNKVCTDAYAGAAVGAAFGPIGLAISYSIATGVVEGKLIPNLEKAFTETRWRPCLTIWKIWYKPHKRISRKPRAVIGNISSQITTSETIVNAWVYCPKDLFDSLKKQTTILIEMYSDYIKRADSKKK